MADSVTALYEFVKPEVGASADTWGSKWNTNNDDYDALLGALVTTGSANAYVLTTGLSLSAYAAKQRFLVRWNHTNSGAATLNVDTLGAKTIKKRDGSTDVAASDLVQNYYGIVVYDGTNFVHVGHVPSEVQPLDATLTALAALSWSSGNMYIAMTAADTFSVSAAPQIDSINLGHASDTTLTRSAAGILAVESVDVVLCAGAQTVAGAKTFTSDVTINKAAPLLKLQDSGGSTFDILSTANVLRIQRPGVATLVNADASLWDQIVPFRARTATSAETSGTLTSASSNKVVVTTAGVTINDGVHTAGDMIAIYNNSASSVTITQDTGMTLRLHGTTTTGNRTLAARGMASVYFVSATEAVVMGDVS